MMKALALLLPILLAGPVQAGDDRTLSPYFAVEGDQNAVESFPLKATFVSATVNGVIADILVTQTYANQGARPINAKYVFPASTRAAVHGVTMRLDGQVIAARIEERRRARADFETAKREGKSASLLEQQRPNVFTMSVANVMPGDSVEVELHYTELLIPQEGVYQFVYPAVVGPRYANGKEAPVRADHSWAAGLYQPSAVAAAAAAKHWGSFGVSVTLSTGLPLQVVASRSHAVDIAYDAGNVARIELDPDDEPGGDRDFILDYSLAGDAIESGLLLHQGEKENFFLLMVQPPDRFEPADIPPREYVFVLDVSGSMDGFPLSTAKSLLTGLVGGLRAIDLFNVILFAGGSEMMAHESLPAIEENVAAAIGIIERARGGGSTELIPALRTAFLLPSHPGYSRTIVVITDGYVTADREAFEIIRENLGQANVFSFGIGSSVNRHLVEGMARAGLGEPFVVTKPEEAAEAADRFRSYVESPLLTNVKVDFRGFDAYDIEPPALPNLFAGRPIILHGKWRGASQGEIEVSGDLSAGRYSRTFFPEEWPVAGNGALRYLWARSRLARLSDFSFGVDDPDLEKAITALGLEHSLLTKNTSFVAVVEQTRNTRGGSKDVDQPLTIPRGVGLDAGGAYAFGSEPAIWIVAGMAGLVLLFSRRWLL